MGPYCNFCGNRCFIPAPENDLVQTDLKATCREGVLFDLNKELKKLLIEAAPIMEKVYLRKNWFERVNKALKE